MASAGSVSGPHLVGGPTAAGVVAGVGVGLECGGAPTDISAMISGLAFPSGGLTGPGGAAGPGDSPLERELRLEIKDFFWCDVFSLYLICCYVMDPQTDGWTESKKGNEFGLCCNVGIQ